jgi:uncharacterized protein YerC
LKFNKRLTKKEIAKLKKLKDKVIVEDNVNSSFKLKQLIRREKVAQLICEGKTRVEIAKILGVSTKTIDSDLMSDGGNYFEKELLRRQLRDIHDCRDIKLRLKYRDKLLDKFFKYI